MFFHSRLAVVALDYAIWGALGKIFIKSDNSKLRRGNLSRKFHYTKIANSSILKITLNSSK